MLVHICGAPIWRLENSVNIWNLLGLSWWVIICTEQTDIYQAFYKLDRHLVSRTATTQKFKMLWFPIEARYWALKLQTDTNLPPLMPDEDKNFHGSIVLDFRKWWHHVKTIYCGIYSQPSFNVITVVRKHLKVLIFCPVILVLLLFFTSIFIYFSSRTLLHHSLHRWSLKPQALHFTYTCMSTQWNLF